ncbi:MAG: creatininase, partial [Proteobacteria bacterium]|nr:creatininase [Pseudomonadota bacterium]
MTSLVTGAQSMSELKDLLRIENGQKVKHTFSDQEYIDRQTKL